MTPEAKGAGAGLGDDAGGTVPSARAKPLSAAASDALLVVDAQGLVVSCSAALETLLGHPGARMLGAPLHDLLELIGVEVDLRAQIAAFEAGGAASESSWPRAIEAVRGDGRPLEMSLSVTAVTLAGQPHAVVVLRDDSELRRLDLQRREALEQVVRLRHQLKQSAEALERVVRQDHAGIMIVGATGTILFANSDAARFLGQSRRSLVGQEFGIPSVLGSTEIDFTYPDRTPGTAEMTSAEASWRGESAYLLILHDVTERKRAEQTTDQDPLTGLSNRALFMDRLHAALRRRRRNADYLALVLVGVDRFKVIDARLGHAVGDAVLRAVARRMSGCLPEANSVAHVGGDKFATILEGLSEPREAQRLIEKVERAIAAPLNLVSSTLSVSASIGVAVAPDDGDDPALLLRHADKAMGAHERIDWGRYGSGAA